jgi:hypothetical protein
MLHLQIHSLSSGKPSSLKSDNNMKKVVYGECSCTAIVMSLLDRSVTIFFSSHDDFMLWNNIYLLGLIYLVYIYINVWAGNYLKEDDNCQ